MCPRPPNISVYYIYFSLKIAIKNEKFPRMNNPEINEHTGKYLVSKWNLTGNACGCIYVQCMLKL